MVLEGSGGDLDGDLEGRRADEKKETDSCITANSSRTGMDNAPPEVFWSMWKSVWSLPSNLRTWGARVEVSKTESFTQRGQTNGYICAREMEILTQEKWDQQEQVSHCNISPSSVPTLPYTHLTTSAMPGPGLVSTSPDSGKRRQPTLAKVEEDQREE